MLRANTGLQCTKCDRPAAVEDRFCSSCGAALGGSAADSTGSSARVRRTRQVALVVIVLAMVAVGVSVYQAVSAEQALERRYVEAVSSSEREDWNQPVVDLR